MSNRFEDTHIAVADRLALGRDLEADAPYLAIPVSNRMVDYEEYYRLSEAEYQRFLADPAGARDFADACRGRRHDDRLILAPGADRGEPR